MKKSISNINSPSGSLAGILRPAGAGYALLYEAGVISGGTLLIALLAHVRIYVGFTPVPITGQTFGVLMIGTLLGSRRGAVCILFYLYAGFIGLPVFAGGTGPAAFKGVTAGYLAGFVAAAYVVGALAERGWDRKTATTFLAMIIGNILIYTGGILWLRLALGMNEAMSLGVYPFITGDLLKAGLATALLPLGWKFMALPGVAVEKGNDVRRI